MRQFVLTRSAYGSAWDLEANRRRLAMTRAVTVPSMAAQTSKRWEWLVAIDISDPLATERMALFESAGVPVRFVEVRSTADRAAAAVEAYRAPWSEVIGHRHDTVAMTRLDDDDALAPWAMAKIGRAAAGTTTRTVLIMPRGVRVFEGRITLVTHESNAMHTLVTPPGDTLHVYAYGHRDVTGRKGKPKPAPVKRIDTRLAWVWSRHADTISGWHEAAYPLMDAVRDLFPIDWSIFGPVPEGKVGKPVRLGVRFR